MGLTTSIPTSQSRSSAEPDDRTIDPLLGHPGDGEIDALVDEVFLPAAEQVDQAHALDTGHFEKLASLGLYGMAVPQELGGLGWEPGKVRHVLRRLSSGCGATSFAFAQHHGTVSALAATENQGLKDRWLPGLVTDRLAGIAYAHVRRPGPPVLSARTDGDGGWLLTGSAPWVTSWGLAAVIGVAASTADGQMVWSLVRAEKQSGLAEGKRFSLMVFGATQTLALHFDDYRVPAADVLSVVDAKTWAERDRLMAARPNPLCVGVGDRALAYLELAAPEVARTFRPWWQDLTVRAEDQCRSVDIGDADLGEVAKTRAEVLGAVQRLTTALVAAKGGGAMELSHPAQRLARESLFYVVQAQSADGRAATFEHLQLGQ